MVDIDEVYNSLRNYQSAFNYPNGACPLLLYKI